MGKHHAVVLVTIFHMPFPHFWEYFIEKSVVDFKYGQLDKKNAIWKLCLLALTEHITPLNVGAYFPIKSFEIYKVDFSCEIFSKVKLRGEKSTEVVN